VVLCAFIALGLVGCASSTRRHDLWGQHFGIRPDEPVVEPTEESCAAYAKYATYTQQLQEAYHSRATQNRFWIYAAAILGLGATAASGGLAAAAASATTIGLVAISGGFAGATFAALNNPDLARVYTVAANKLDTALIESDRQLRTTPGLAACGAALSTLKEGVSEARILLEEARTNNAVAAIIRAKEEQKTLAKLIETVEESNPTRPPVSAFITDIQPPNLPALGAAATRDVTLTVSNIQLDRIAPAYVKVVIGSAEPISARVTKTAEFTYSVQFRAPDAPPDPPQKVYPVILLVGKSKQRVPSKGTLTYP
jgi:hypothetical protein